MGAPGARGGLTGERASVALGWLWAGSFAFFLSFFLLLSALPLYAREAGLSDGAIGLVVGAFAAASMLAKPFAGWAADRFGRRPLLLAGAAVFVAASMLYGLAGSAGALLAVRLVHGFGMGLYPTAASAAVADLAPPARRGELLGRLGAAGSLAMALGPIAGMALARRLGFAALFGVSALAAGVALLLTWRVHESAPGAGAAPFRMAGTLSRAAATPAAVALLAMLTYGVQVSFLPLHAAARGLDAGLFFLAFALAVASVRGAAGRFSDRRGRRLVTAAGLTVQAAAVALLAVTGDGVALAGAGALYGVGFGVAQSALVAWCVDGARPADRGRAMGTFYAAFELGIAAGASGAGLAVGAFGFVPTFAGAALVTLAAAALALAAPAAGAASRARG